MNYQAPEIIANKVRTCSVDIWAAGAILHQQIEIGAPSQRGYTTSSSAPEQLLLAALLKPDPKERLTAPEAAELAYNWEKSASEKAGREGVPPRQNTPATYEGCLER